MTRSLYTPEENLAAQLMAAEDFYFFVRWMFKQRKGYTWLRAMHHKLICEALMRVYTGETKNLIINIPPRYSKTEIAVINFVAWCMGKCPDAEFIIPSYGASLAQNNSFQARDLVQHEAYQGIFPETEVSKDNSSKGDWSTTLGGRVYAPGVGGPTTGMGAGKRRPGFGGAIIIDDPHKADEARSDPIRSGVLNWFMETVQSRRNDPRNTPIVIIMQRLHEEDLTGWLLKGNSGMEWEHLKLPAVMLDEEGERYALWPEMHTLPELDKMATAAPYMFGGQYAQEPSAAEGNVFKPGKIEIVDAAPFGVRWVRGWDFAGSVPEPGRMSPDYTAGARIGELPDGRYIIGHCVREQGAPEDVESLLKQTTVADKHTTKVDIPQDPGQAGKSQVARFTKLLKGYRVSSSPESGDKVQRAEPFAAQVNVGNVLMVKGDWNTPYLDELRMFPNAAHDDQVDASSRAFNKLTGTNRLVISDATIRKASARAAR